MKMTVRGIDDVNKLLEQIAPRQAHNIMRATVHDMAREVSKDAKANMPVDRGEMKKATKHKRERAMPGQPISSTVRVNPRAFYWRFLEYGDGPDQVEHAFFLKSVEKLRGNLLPVFLRSFGKKWEAALARAAKRNAGR